MIIDISWYDREVCGKSFKAMPDRGGELKGIPLQTQKWVLSSDSNLLTIRDHYQIQELPRPNDNLLSSHIRQQHLKCYCVDCLLSGQNGLLQLF